MEPKEVYLRSLLEQYRVFRQELIIFTIFLLLALLLIPVAWVQNHVDHNFTLGCMIAFVALVLGLSMATHCGNHIQVLRRVTSHLNKEMAPRYQSFEYDQGQETDRLRYVVTVIGKIIACLVLVWCFIRWPQL